MPSLLVTNDFPPKLGGIQSYLYELWRRLPPAETTVLTTPYAGAAEWDAAPGVPGRAVAREGVAADARHGARAIDALAREVGADVIFLDPMLPIGLIGPHLHRGAVRRGRARQRDHRLRAHARAAARSRGGCSAARPRWSPPAPIRRGEATRGRGPSAAGRASSRRASTASASTRSTTDDRAPRPAGRFGLDPDRPLVLGLSRLVPRKGFDVLIDAIATLDRRAARDRGRRPRPAPAREARRAATCGSSAGSPTPTCPRCTRRADVFAMCCRDRWGGLEAEGFGIVFLEAAGVRGAGGRRAGAAARTRRSPTARPASS